MQSTTAVAQSLLAALEKTLKNTEIEKCTVTEPTDLVECDHQEPPDTGFLISKTSPQTCQMIEHNTQASWNPLNGQQHKKHKKKRKVKPIKYETVGNNKKEHTHRNEKTI